METESEKIDIEIGESIPLQQNGVRFFIKSYLNCHILPYMHHYIPAFVPL